MAGLIVAFPGSDQAGPWQQTPPIPVSAGSYVQPDVKVAGWAAYTTGDFAAAALQTDGITVGLGRASSKYILVTSVTDETSSNALTTGDEPTMPASNASWTLVSIISGGSTTTLKYGTDETADLGGHASAADIQTALEALPSIGSGNVACTGGPLGSGGIVTVTLQGTLAGSAGSGELTNEFEDYTVTRVTYGHDLKTFTLGYAINAPQATTAKTPQLHVWWVAGDASDVGRKVTFKVADHGTLRSWAAVLLNATNLHGTPFPQVQSATGSGTGGSPPSATPDYDGSLLVTIAAKALASGVYSGTVPLAGQVLGSHEMTGYESLVAAQGDATTLQAWVSGMVTTAAAVSPPGVVWGDSELSTLVTLELRPAAAPTIGASLWDHLNSTLDDSWVEIGPMAGNVYEVVKLDVAALPAGVVPVSVSIEVHQQANVTSGLHVVLAGYDGTTLRVASERDITTAVTSEQTTTTYTWRDFQGTPIRDGGDLAIAFWSDARAVGLTTHRIFYLRASVTYDYAPQLTVTGPPSSGDPISWVYSNLSGAPQTAYEVAIFKGYGADPDTAVQAANPIDPGTGERAWTTGKITSSTDRSYLPTRLPMNRGQGTAAVRAWSRISTGEEIVGEWATGNFDSGTPAAPPSQPHHPEYDVEETGLVKVPVEVPGGATQAWLLRSTDGGLTWSIAGPPTDVT